MSASVVIVDSITSAVSVFSSVLSVSAAVLSNGEIFAKMKKSAILINTSRGPIVDEQALIEALENGEIAGAGLDVFEDEKSPLDKRLVNADNVALTPHVAWNTDIAVTAIHQEVGDNIVRYLNGERPISIVNGI